MAEAGKYVKDAIDSGRLNDEAAGFKRRLAKILFYEKPDLFDSLDQVRSLIRYYTDASGDAKRKNKPDVIHPYAVPKYAYEKPRVVTIPQSVIRLGIVSDIHIPFEDREALQKAYQDLKDRQIQALILNGDIIDCGEPSRWGVGPSTASFSYELDALYEFMIYTREIFGNIPIYYKEGNHEERVKKNMWQKVPHLAKELDFFEIASLRDFDIFRVYSGDHVEFNDLHIYHGHEFRTSSIVYPAKTIWNKTFAQKNIIMGHLHVTDNFKKAKSTSTHITGCLCDLQATYDMASDYRWNHGYAYVEKFGSTFKLDNVQI